MFGSRRVARRTARRTARRVDRRRFWDGARRPPTSRTAACAPRASTIVPGGRHSAVRWPRTLPRWSR